MLKIYSYFEILCYRYTYLLTLGRALIVWFFFFTPIFNFWLNSRAFWITFSYNIFDVPNLKNKKNLKHSLKIYNIMHKPATMKIVSGLEHYWNMYYSSTHYFPQINSHSGRYISIVLYIIQKRTLSKSWYSLLDKTHANSKMDKKHNR